MPSETTKYDDVAKLGTRLANLRTSTGYALDIEMQDGILNVTETAASLNIPAPRDMDHLLQDGLGGQVRAVLDAASGQRGATVMIDTARAQFAPLVTRPEKIICIGFNYRKHAEETGTPIPKEPPLFAKYRNALNNHGGTIKLPTKIDNRFDFETELVVVIGREC